MIIIGLARFILAASLYGILAFVVVCLPVFLMQSVDDDDGNCVQATLGQSTKT